MYNGLIEQFNSKYEEEEKNLLFLYKSKIGIAINSLNKNEDVINGVYEYYKKVLTNPKNMFMNFTVFKDISLDSLESFRESLETINDKIEPLLSKLEIEEPIIEKLLSPSPMLKRCGITDEQRQAQWKELFAKALNKNNR